MTKTRDGFVNKRQASERAWCLQAMAREIVRLRNIYSEDPRRVDCLIEAESVATERFVVMRDND